LNDSAPIVESVSPRVFPTITDANRSYWTGGENGRMHMPRCRSCRRWAPVGASVCQECGGSTEAEPVSGRGRVFSYTLNLHQFHPDISPPNLVAIVELDEQDDLRVATNLVNCDESELRIGMAVSVIFEHHGEIYYPVFTPAVPRYEPGDPRDRDNQVRPRAK
jgi:uncharacterized OB-fold protein